MNAPREPASPDSHRGLSDLDPLPRVTIRTTSGGDGYEHGVAVGDDSESAGALANLRLEAMRMVRVILADLPAPASGRWDTRGWTIEVVDVRLTYAGADGQPEWTAYGTLRTTGLPIPEVRSRSRTTKPSHARGHRQADSGGGS
jgi:hypothetical protein